MKLKYVMFDQIFPVLFSPAMSHRDFIDFNSPNIDGKITSAGFVSVAPDGDNVQAVAYGQSDSLNLKAVDEDSRWITKMLNPEW